MRGGANSSSLGGAESLPSLVPPEAREGASIGSSPSGGSVGAPSPSLTCVELLAPLAPSPSLTHAKLLSSLHPSPVLAPCVDTPASSPDIS